MSTYIGEIKLFAGNFAPVNWKICNGQELVINDYDTLFQLIGTTYGGDGTTTFALPDLRSRVPVHLGVPPSTGTTYTIGETGGVESVTLTVNQIPVHTHAFTASASGATDPNPQGNVIASPPTLTPFIVDTPATPMAANMIAPTGGSQPHENRMPCVAVNYIIAVENAVFPSPT
jgi:microcystin-dependent protein